MRDGAITDRDLMLGMGYAISATVVVDAAVERKLAASSSVVLVGVSFLP